LEEEEAIEPDLNGPAGRLHLVPDLRRCDPMFAIRCRPVLSSSTDRSADEACMVQVPGTSWFGSGHCVGTVGLLNEIWPLGAGYRGVIRHWCGVRTATRCRGSQCCPGGKAQDPSR